MNKENNKDIEKLRLNIYGLLAILIVIIPEWFAELALRVGYKDINNIQIKKGAWNKYPSLKLASMNTKELRILANKLKIFGYSSDTKAILSKRILKRLKRRRARKILKEIGEWNAL